MILQVGASILGLQRRCDSPLPALWSNTEHSAAQSFPAQCHHGSPGEFTQGAPDGSKETFHFAFSGVHSGRESGGYRGLSARDIS